MTELARVRPAPEDSPTLTLQREAFAALIDSRLRAGERAHAGHAALKLLQELRDAHYASTTENPDNGLVTLWLLGLANRVPQNSAYALLRDWQQTARR